MPAAVRVAEAQARTYRRNWQASITVAFVSPIFGVIFGRTLKGEPLTTSLVVGGILVGVGIYLSASDRASHVTDSGVELPGEDAA